LTLDPRKMNPSFGHLVLISFILFLTRVCLASIQKERTFVQLKKERALVVLQDAGGEVIDVQHNEDIAAVVQDTLQEQPVF